MIAPSNAPLTGKQQIATLEAKGYRVLCTRPSGWAHLVQLPGNEHVWRIAGGSVDSPSLMMHNKPCDLPDCTLKALRR